MTGLMQDTAFRFAIGTPNAHMVITGYLESPRELVYCYTAGGRKLHYAWDDSPLTLCGFVPARLVLPEEPLPDQAVCDWCRAARMKETR